MSRHLPAVATCILIAANVLGSARITVRNIDLPNAGLNDSTAAQPVGGNSGTTVGQQRMIALQVAADLWGQFLDSDVEIVIEAKMGSLTCDASSALLAQTGPKNVVANFLNAPKPDVWYPIALANKFAHTDLDPSNADISAVFNNNLGNGTCFGTTGWYYGLDDNHGATVDMVTVALHEFAHGLGVSGTYNSKTGAFFQGKPNVFELHTLDNTTGLRWDQMNDAQRLTSSTNDQNLVWDGEAARFSASRLLGPTPFLRTGSETLSVGTASFGAPVTVAEIASNVVAAADDANADGPSTTDGCTALTNAPAIIGRIALVDRGTCRFVIKAKNAQDAGAIALVIVDNVADTSPPALGGDDPSITIPVISLTKSDGDALRAQTPDVFVLIAADPQHLSGADANHFVKLFAPGAFQGGSSVHHWDTSANPDLLMEPSISSRLTHGVDITIDQLIDIGWTEPVTGRRALRRNK